MESASGSCEAAEGCEVGGEKSGRKEKRKALKKQKRKQCRQQLAEVARLQEETLLQDPAEQLRIRQQTELEEERERLEWEKHQEEERLWLEREQQMQEESERRQQEQLKNNSAQVADEEDGEYEDGPSELIWEGNEITVIKHRVKVGKLEADMKEDKNEEKHRPICNPPPPRSFYNMINQSTNEGTDYNRNYGTEQDKMHCPFHIKTGACRFQSRCSRIHVYPEKSCTLLIKNMYTGPGLAWEHDEGLEYTDDEVAEQFEEFYEDVHSEFLKFGELVNFKVCRNSSPHLRGNVYVHYRSEDSAIAACLALSGRFYANKQIIPQFVEVTKWKVALCGDYMKPQQRTCSRGTSCNFLHCFRNPGGEYDWADRDLRPPSSWKQKMASLFGYEDVPHDSDRWRDDSYHHHRFKRRETPQHDHHDKHSRSRLTTSRSRHSRREDHSDNSSDKDRRRDKRSERRRRSRSRSRSLPAASRGRWQGGS